MQLKVGDFGLAAKVLFEGEKKRTICGTPNYIAPEILDAKLGHSYEVDYWSIGVILYTLLCGRPPFESPEVKQTYKKIKSCQYQFPETVTVSDQAKDFVHRLLKAEPSQRMTLKDMLAHEFMNMNKIPDFLPISTLVCPPSATYVKQYIPSLEDKTEQPVISSARVFNMNMVSARKDNFATTRDQAQLFNPETQLTARYQTQQQQSPRQQEFQFTQKPKLDNFLPHSSRPATTPTNHKLLNNNLLSVSPHKATTPKNILDKKTLNQQLDISPHLNRIASTKTFEKENINGMKVTQFEPIKEERDQHMAKIEYTVAKQISADKLVYDT